MSAQPRRNTESARQETFLRKMELKNSPVKGHPAPWIFKAAGIGQLLTVPWYFVFYMDYGDQEHVFSEPRRWLQRQKEGFLGTHYKNTQMTPAADQSSKSE
ncbi:hypothetical protein M407DRAFT_26430 [Tulasnella calospora MUT 4182]|uniref:Uncharacterized protein n=1 Tax=Tulasnella calospora MUT 4182 TaxID=1051891 RepID=A0A0C3QE97_9AGAM|nr:hypothetical protein M407DRAFT_26430 [Tulasnella calospora MUT 4182]